MHDCVHLGSFVVLNPSCESAPDDASLASLTCQVVAAAAVELKETAGCVALEAAADFRGCFLFGTPGTAPTPAALAGGVAAGPDSVSVPGPGARRAESGCMARYLRMSDDIASQVESGTLAPAAEPLISALREIAVQSSLHSLGGYDLSRTGSVEFLS